MWSYNFYTKLFSWSLDKYTSKFDVEFNKHCWNIETFSNNFEKTKVKKKSAEGWDALSGADQNKYLVKFFEKKLTWEYTSKNKQKFFKKKVGVYYTFNNLLVNNREFLETTNTSFKVLNFFKKYNDLLFLEKDFVYEKSGFFRRIKVSPYITADIKTNSTNIKFDTTVRKVDYIALFFKNNIKNLINKKKIYKIFYNLVNSEIIFLGYKLSKNSSLRDLGLQVKKDLLSLRYENELFFLKFEKFLLFLKHKKFLLICIFFI